MGLRDPAWWLEKLYNDGIPIRGGSGGGTPSDPEEVDISRYGGTATTLGRTVPGSSIPVAPDEVTFDTLNDSFNNLVDLNVKIGDTNNAAVITDADGTVSAKLRGLVAILANAWNSSIGALRTIPAPSTTANTPAIVTAAATDAFALNAARKVWSIQNMGTNTLYVRLGTAASTTVFHFALKPGTVNDDGNGGYISDEIWKGVVSYAGTSPRFVYSELT